MNQVTDLSIKRIIQTLVRAEGSDSIGIMAVGKVLIVYDGVNPLHRYVCSTPMEASKTADRIQRAYEAGFFQTNERLMM